MRVVVEDFDEGLIAALVYELSQLNVRKASRHRIHPLEKKIVIEVDADNPEEAIKEAIKRLKEKLANVKSQIC